MKNKFIIVLLALTIILTSCGREKEKTDDKIEITTSFYPLYDFSQKIGGDRVRVSNLLKSGNAHGWEPNTKDMKEILGADVIFINGAGFESWVEGIEKSNPDLNIVDTSLNIDLIELEEDNHEDHDHEGHDHGDHDPHIWLSLDNAISQMELIKESLITLDGDNKDYYEGNFQREKDKILDLKARYQEELAPYKGKHFIVPHEAFGYLARDYGLKQEALEGINSESEPNIRQVKEIVDLCKEKEISTIFYEYGASSKIAETIAEEVGGKVLALTTLEVVDKADIDQGKDYFSLMEMNLENLLEGLRDKKWLKLKTYLLNMMTILF